MKRVAIFLFLVNCLSVFSQEVISVEDIQAINKNMSAYRFYYSNYIGCHNKPMLFLNNYLLKENERYDIDIVNVKEEYPNESIILYKVSNNYYTTLKKRDSTSVDISFYDGKTYEDILSRNMLIGLEKKENKLVFISGNVFKNCISADFDLNEKRPNSFDSFLRFKLYNYSIEKLEFIKRRKNYLYFKAYSELLKTKISIKVNRRDFDDIQVKTISPTWTENGSYKWEK